MVNESMMAPLGMGRFKPAYLAILKPLTELRSGLARSNAARRVIGQEAPMSIRDSFKRACPCSLYAGVTWLLWLFLLAILLWAVNKSLAYADEAFLLLSYKYPGETIRSTTHFALIVSGLFGWMHPGVITFRLLKLSLGVGSAAVFAAGLSRWMRSMAPDRSSPWPRFSILFPFVASGDLFGYSTFGQTLSYDSLNDCVFLLCYGILLMTFAGTATMSIRLASAYVVVGALAGLDFFVKFSSSLVLVGICVSAVVLAGTRAGWRAIVCRVATLTCGYLAGMAVFFLLFLNVFTWVANFRAGLADFSSGWHNPHLLFSLSVANSALLLRTAAPQTAVSGALFYLLSHLITSDDTRNPVARLLTYLVAALIWVILELLALEGTLYVYESGAPWGTVVGVATVIAFQAGLLLATLVASRAHVRGLMGRSRRFIGITLFLFIAPFAGTIGSNVQFLSAATEYMAFWFALIALLLLATPRLSWNRLVLPAFWAVPLVLVAALVVQGLVLQPAEVGQSLLAQTAMLAQSGDLGSLQVDGNTKAFFQTVRGIITRNSDYRPGDPIIVAYDLPALVYALGGVSPGTPWFYGSPMEQRRDCGELQSTHLRDLSRSIVIVTSPVQPSFSRCLHAVRIAFPQHYRLAGSARSPYDGATAKVYVPLAQG